MAFGRTGGSSTGVARTAPVWMLPIRIVQFIFGLLILALCGYSRNQFGDGYTLSQAYNFGIFVGLFVMICTVVLMVSSCVAALHHPIVPLILDALCLLFLTVCWPLLAGYSAKYKNYGISAYYDYYYYDYFYTASSFNGWKTGVAAAVFGAILWLTFIFTLIFSVTHLRKGFGGARGTGATPMGTTAGSTGPVYGNNAGTGGPMHNQGYPQSQPSYNTGAPVNQGYVNQPAYEQKPAV